MQRITTIIIAIFLSTMAFTQEIKSKSIDTVSITEVEIGEKLISYQRGPDGKKVYLKGIDLLEELESRRATLSKIPENAGMSVTEVSARITNRPARQPRRSFNGSWRGLELGYNGYFMPDGSTDIAGEAAFMSLNERKSLNFNINFCQIDIGLTHHIGFVTGMGLHFSNYRFSGNNSITVNEDGIIVPSYPADNINYDKTKLVTKYLTAPLFLEIQIPTSSRKRVNIAAGVVGALKVGDHAKVVYQQNGKQKLKDRGDFNLNRIRYGYTIRAGYGSIQLYGTRYETPLFKEDRGPELYPYEAGISWTLF